MRNPVDPLHRRIAALESEVRRLSANQVSTSGLGGAQSRLEEAMRRADQDIARRQARYSQGYW